MWTDTHCHLDEDRYRGEGNKNLGGTIGVLENARAAQVSRFITVGCDADSSRAAIECAHQFDDVWASVGLHPHEAVHGVDTIVELISSALMRLDDALTSEHFSVSQESSPLSPPKMSLKLQLCARSIASWLRPTAHISPPSLFGVGPINQPMLRLWAPTSLI